MAWHYKSPQTFPAFYVQTLREATAEPNVPVPLGSYLALSDAEDIAERFRWFRWCIRQTPTPFSDLNLLLEGFEIRSKIHSDECGHVVFVTAKPNKLQEFIRLNPELAADVLTRVRAEGS